MLLIAHFSVGAASSLQDVPDVLYCNSSEEPTKHLIVDRL